MSIPYTPEEITEILNEYFSGITHKQYIGARYVPIFGRKNEESILWDNSGTYEPLTIVLYQGNSYTSRQYVPIGVDITNQAYWANTGNYNAQVEQLRQTVLGYVEDVEELSGDVSELETATDEIGKKLQNVYSVLNFEGITNDGSDITIALQTAIDSIPENSVIVFPHGTYQFGEVNLKNNCTYDFCGSEIIVNEIVGLHAKGAFVNTLDVGSTAANQKTFSTSVLLNVRKGQLLRFINTNELAHRGRAYYYKGFSAVCEIIENSTCVLNASVPYAMGTDTKCEVYNPCTVNIENIGKIVSTYKDTASYPIFIEYGYNCKVSNVHIEAVDTNGIAIYRCVNTIIDRITGYNLISENTFNYGVAILSSTNTVVENCDMSSEWHCITTGGEESVLNTTVRDSVLSTLGTSPGYDDHENAINTLLDNVTTDGFCVGGKIINSKIYVKGGMRFFPINVEDKYAKYAMSNCVIVAEQASNISLGFTAQTSTDTEWSINEITFNNVKVEGTHNVEILKPTAATNITRIGKLILDNAPLHCTIGYTQQSHIDKFIVSNTVFESKTIGIRFTAKSVEISNCCYIVGDDSYYCELNGSQNLVNNFIFDVTTNSITEVTSYKMLIRDNNMAILNNIFVTGDVTVTTANRELIQRGGSTRVIFNNTFNVKFVDNAIPHFANNVYASDGNVHARAVNGGTLYKYVYGATGLAVE